MRRRGLRILKMTIVQSRRVESTRRESGRTSIWDRRVSISSKQPNHLALDADAVGWENADLVGGVGGLECNRGAAASEALEGRLLVIDQCDDDIAGVGG